MFSRMVSFKSLAQKNNGKFGIVGLAAASKKARANRMAGTYAAEEVWLFRQI
jgi:hypothetical protein